MSASTIQASVIVCTYNRAESLRHTLNALAAQQLPSTVEWELIVVDNNSSDQTREVVLAAQAQFATLHYLHEPRQGLSFARNCGIAAARGEVLLFTDDDVRPEPDWIATVLAALEREQAEACGGYIAPDWEVAPPAWLTERFYGFLAIKTETAACRIDTLDRLPFGANMAFRRQLFDRFGRFDTERGRKGNQLASGEDGELFARLIRAGIKVIHVPEARVHHRIEAFRVEKRYFRRWRSHTSRNLAQTAGLPGERRLAGIPLYLFAQLARAAWRTLVGYLTAPADEAFHREVVLWHFIGTLDGLWRSRHRPVQP